MGARHGGPRAPVGGQVRPQGSRCLVPSAQRQTHQEEGRLVTRGRWGQRGHLCAMWAGAQGPTSGQVDGRAAGGEALLPAQRGHRSPQASQRRRCLASRLAGRAVHTRMPWLCPAPQAALAIRKPRSCGLGTFPVGRSCAKPTPSMSGRQRRACAGAEPSGASLHLHLTRACLACCWSHCEHRALGPRGAWPLGLACRVGKVQGAETKQLMRPWEAWLPASWASFTQGHLGPGQGGLLSRAAACRWHGPAVGRACLGPAGPRSRKGPSLGGSSLGPACPPPSALTGPGQPVCGQQAQGGSGADWLWLWPQPLLLKPQAPQPSPGSGRVWAGGATQASGGQGASRALSPPAGLCPGMEGCLFGVYPPWREDTPRVQQEGPGGLGISVGRTGAGGHRREVR